MKHICWYVGNNVKCKICYKYKWDKELKPIKEEKREWRECLGQFNNGCEKEVYGLNSDRLCRMCKKVVELR